jgi:hypothetical protein
LRHFAELPLALYFRHAAADSYFAAIFADASASIRFHFRFSILLSIIFHFHFIIAAFSRYFAHFAIISRHYAAMPPLLFQILFAFHAAAISRRR